MKDDPATPRLTWTASQRRALLVLVSGLLVLLVFRHLLNPAYVPDPQPVVPSRFADLADRIDPNTADWQTLAALPSIGEKRAKQIVAYRDDFTARHPGQPAFARPDDLQRIRGIGPAITAAIQPYLIFPTAAAPTTRPD